MELEGKKGQKKIKRNSFKVMFSVFNETPSSADITILIFVYSIHTDTPQYDYMI